MLTLRMLMGARLGQVGELLPPDQGPIRPQEFRGSQAQGLEALPFAWLCSGITRGITKGTIFGSPHSGIS